MYITSIVCTLTHLYRQKQQNTRAQHTGQSMLCENEN